MKTIKVKEADFKINTYYLIVNCPYCKNKVPFTTIGQYIDKTDYCPKCGKEFKVTSKEIETDYLPT